MTSDKDINSTELFEKGKRSKTLLLFTTARVAGSEPHEF